MKIDLKEIDLHLDTTHGASGIEVVEYANLNEITNYQFFDHKKIRDLDLKKSYNPKPGDKLYLAPGLNIPRVKLKDLLLNNGVTTTREITKATHIFVEPTFHKFHKGEWKYSVNIKAFKQLVELLKEKDHLDEEDYDEIITELKDCKETIATNWSIQRAIRDRELDIYKNCSEIYASIQNNHSYNFVLEEMIELYDYILANPSLIYDEKPLIDQINGEDSVTIDLKVFEQLRTMFESSDQDNHVMAMEIMANSNYKESLLFIELLFHHCGNQINNSNTKRHVNFKSLVNYLGKSLNYLYSTSINDVIESLVKKDVITEEKLDFILNNYKEHLVQDNLYFSVKQVTLNEELLKKLNINYKRDLVSDFIPEILEKIEELEKEEIKENEFDWM